MITVGAAPPRLSAQAQDVVGVVYFYAPTPITPIDSVIPEGYAAATLTVMLSHASSGAFTIIPRDVMSRAEEAMGWQERDALNFGRLSALARAVGATDLVVGWIPLFAVSGSGPSAVESNPPMGQTTVVVQLFDVAQGRITAETRSYGSSVGALPLILARQAIDDALAPAVPFVAQSLTHAPAH